ncbi:MAG: ribosome-associated translation inhibitor RaiA [Candidatus Saccharimonadales bacterium]
MIDLEVTGVHFEINEQITKYVNKKLGRLDKYLPRNARTPAHGRVVLVEEQGQSSNRYSAEATITFPHGEVVAQDATISMYAAIDIVEEKLKAQILKHKDKRQNDRQAQRTRRSFKVFKPSRDSQVNSEEPLE